ncbi:MAG: hypothetical protein AAB116_17155 [Candidatus Poribacteria bacterium]|mgnify:CR=1 FL=1
MITLIALIALCFTSAQSDKEVQKPTVSQKSNNWTQDFGLEKRTLLTTGENQFFILKPGFQLIFEGGKTKLLITVLDETKKIGEITTRVVEEREEENGKLAEVSRNYFAICKDTGDVFYFGEDVDNYKNGKIANHSGSWLADGKNSKPGMIMPGKPSIGAKYYQEISPGKAMDRAEVISISETLKTPGGTFENCLKTQETTALDPKEKEYKIYAPGIGLIKDADLLLTKYGYISK